MRCHLARTLVWSQVTVFYTGSLVPLWKGEILGSEPPVCTNVTYRQIALVVVIITIVDEILNELVNVLFFSQTLWMSDIYYPPWCRAGPYFVGVLLGFLLFRVNRQLKMHPVSTSLFTAT